MTTDENFVQAKLCPLEINIWKIGSVLNTDIARKNFLKSIVQNAKIFQRECESCERFRKVFSSSFLPACLERWGSQHCAFWSSSECQDSGNNIFSLLLFQIKFHGNQWCICFGLHFCYCLKTFVIQMSFKNLPTMRRNMRWSKKKMLPNPWIGN